MERQIRASVAMAVYNGAKYIREQLDSILEMMTDDDEIIISYDDSKDNTWNIITEYSQQDKRIKVYKNELNKGTGGNFQNAINHCKGEYIFFADQDDVWINDKINVVINELKKSDKAFAVHDGYITDKELNIVGEPLFGGNKISTNPFRVWFKNTGITLGCCEAFKREYLPLISPFPNDDHDVWTISICSFIGGIHVIYKPLILHRVHGENVSKTYRRPMVVVLFSRIILLIRLIVRMMKYKIAN